MTIEDSGTFDIGGELTVHRLGYGAMHLTGEHITGPPADEESARDVVRHAIELGVDFVDTADSYGPAVSERLVGEALAGDAVAREDVVVATKGGLVRTVHEEFEWDRHGHPGHLQHAAYCSRDRLGVDEIDLYQLHRVDPEVPIEDSVTALAELQDEGVIRHVGLSNVGVEQLDRAQDVCEIATVQNQYSVVERDHERVLDACEEYGIGFMPWSPMNSGDLGAKADALDAAAEAHDATRRQIALVWLLERSPNLLPIPGTASIDHLEQNVAAAEIELTDDEFARLAE